MLDDYGGFTARATVAGAYPVEGAIVRMLGAEEENRDIAYSVLTDMDGLTPKIALPAPSVSYSLTPQDNIPYSLYDIEIYKEGYYPKKISGISVFPGQDSLLEINMIPMDSQTENTEPNGNLDANV